MTEVVWMHCPACCEALGEMYSVELAAALSNTCWNCEGALVPEVVG